MSPAPFEKCIREGGRVFTVKTGKSHYTYGCKPKGGGPAVYGERHKKKSSSK